MSISYQRQIVFLAPIVWILSGVVLSSVSAVAAPVPKKGPNVVLIKTWFMDDAGGSRRAYYVSVERLP